KESFTRTEVAAILGINPPSVSSLVRFHRLETTDKGSARRFPRSTVLALQERLGRGMGIQTANYYLRDIQSFCRWLVQDRRTGDNPLIHLTGGNVRLDRRHDRRELEADELRLVLT